MVFLTSAGALVYYDFSTHTKIRSIAIEEKLTQGCFRCMEILKNGIVQIFCAISAVEVNINLETGHVEYVPFTRLSDITFYAPHPELPHISLAIDGKAIEIVDDKKMLNSTIKEITCSHWISYDPLNTMHCLSVGEKPAWTVFSFLPEVNIIAKAVRDDIKLSCGDWIPAIPGNIITGSSTSGVLYIWSVASGTIIETFQLEDAPVAAIMRISDKAFVVAFRDGNIGIVDVTKKGYLHKFNAAHTNTIFSAYILPTDSNLLLTAGADAKICMWGLPTLSKKGIFPGCSSNDMLMSISPSPGGGYIATGSRKGYVSVIYLKSNKILFSVKLHNGRCTSVAWSPHNPDIIVSAGDDKMCYFYNIKDRKIETTVSVKAELRKIAFSKKENGIAVACYDGNLYVRMAGGAYHVIKGSGSPLFDVAWSPTKANLVATSDDDGGVSVFDIETRTSVRAVGHDKARPVMWSEACEWLLLSGGYDGRIVFWDIRTMTAIGYIKAHMGHIYSLATHPEHPMMFISASRDEMIRVWNYDALFPEQRVSLVLSNQSLVAEKLAPYEGSDELAKLIHRVKRDGTKLTFNDGDLAHINDVLRLAKKRVSRITSALPQDQALLIRAKQARQSAIDAADLCLKSGNIKRYCELMFIAGEYDTALAAAPAVSYNFWQNLMLARAQMMSGTEEGADLTLVAGKPEEAITQMISMKKFDNAMLVAASMRECTFLPRTKSVAVKQVEEEPLPFIRNTLESANDFASYKVASKRSMKYALMGKPLLAAASLLTVGDVVGAAWRLLHCGELLWAIEVNRCLETPDPRIMEFFTQYAIYVNCYSKVFSTLTPKLIRKMVPLVPLTSDTQRNQFYQSIGMKTVDDYLAESKKARGLSRIQFLLLAGKKKEAAALSIQHLKTIMSRPSFDFTQVDDIMSVIQNVYIDDISNDKIWLEVVAVSYYIAGYKALWRGYDSVIERLVVSFESIVIQNQFEWLKPRVQELRLAAALALAKCNTVYGKAYAETIETPSDALKGITSLPDDLSVDGGSTIKARSTGVIPIDIAQVSFTSICSGNKITGNVFMLEDGTSAMEPEEALMWFEVTPFSPLPTHKRIVPY